MKASYNTAKEIAELYINSGLKDRTDVSALIRESSRELMQKVGKEEAMNICMAFMQKVESLHTVEGLTSYLEAIEIDSVDFSNPFTGKIEHTAYIHLKNN